VQQEGGGGGGDAGSYSKCVSVACFALLGLLMQSSMITNGKLAASNVDLKQSLLTKTCCGS
jgi:hypothetical protein